MTLRLTRLALAAAVAAAVASPAWAQPTPTPDGAEPAARFAELRAQRARDMRLLLRLRPDQDAAFAAFDKAMTPPEPPARRGAPPQPMLQSTPQRLDAMARVRAEAQARDARREEAVRVFYAALTPEQREAFDAIARLSGPPGAPPHGGPGGHPQGEPGPPPR